MPTNATTRLSSRIALAGAVLLLGPGAFTVFAVVSAASVQQPRQRPLTIKGDLRVALRPGASQTLNLALTNRYRFTLWVTRLTVGVTVDRRHRAAGCSTSRNFAVRQMPSRAFAIALPRRRTRKLSVLRARPLPRIRMRFLAHSNQDACKGATLRLRYKAVARRSRPAGHGRATTEPGRSSR